MGRVSDQMCFVVQALSGDEHPVLNSVRPPVRKFCMYSERNSGSNWVSSLIEVSCLELASII